MKHEVYSCLKMFESLHKRAINSYNIAAWSSASDLGEEYRRIWKLLEKYLSIEQLEFVKQVERDHIHYDHEKQEYIRKIITACSITLSYLQSLEMDLDKELIIKKDELKLKEKELESREKEIEYMQKLLNKSLEAIKQFPELQRSKIVEDIKKSHRQIEEHTKKD